MQQLTEEFWNNRWATGKTGWDIGYASPAIIEYFEKVEDKNVKILIPGCGNAYEAHTLLKLGFTDITILDISQIAIQRLVKSFEFTKTVKVLHMNFFELHDSFDYVVEQTFFCALHPSLRVKYAKKMFELLKTDGKLVGLLFDRSFPSDGPPYGGNKAMYASIFTPYFKLEKLDKSKSSIPARMGNELFIEFQKK